MPKQVQDSSSTLLGTYNYLADGSKRAVVGGTEELDYLGSLIYKKSGGTRALENILFTEGVINKSGSSYNNTYHIKDHLGSVRVVTDSTGNILEKNDYYPFGLRIATTSETNNRYKFSGKEIQTIVASTFNYLDFGARMYDPVIARWSTQDPMKEKYYGIGQYVYVANNPIKYVDPTGMLVANYFDIYGNFLGTDQMEDYEIRVIDRNDWDENKRHGLSNYSNEIENLFVHEQVHIDDAKQRGMLYINDIRDKRKIHRWEAKAIHRQINHPSFFNTRQKFKSATYNYAQRAGKMIIPINR